MIKSEPKTILSFLANHFDLLKELFELQLQEKLITNGQIKVALINNDADVEKQLYEHKILIQQNDDFIINEPYFKLLEFVLQQFKPLLPEEIEKYKNSINNLYHNARYGKDNDDELLQKRIESLIKEIEKFINDIGKNTISLLNESRKLKANIDMMDHYHKAKKAHFWIRNYITPLTKILDANDSNSIHNNLLNVFDFANHQRVEYGKEFLRRKFEALYYLLRHTIQDIERHLVIITNELLPLIERIKTESTILSGMYLYLNNGNFQKRIPPPKIPNQIKNNGYNSHIFIKTKEYFDLFTKEEKVIIEENFTEQKHWIFDKQLYKERLDNSLPNKSFFTWCKSILKGEEATVENFFMVCSLLFENDYEILFSGKNELVLLDGNIEFVIPQITISKKHD